MKKRGPKKKPWQERFMKRVDINGDCWIWTGRIDKHGTPRFSVSSHSTHTAYYLARKVLGSKEDVMHSYRFMGHKNICGNTLCIHPKHIFASRTADKEEVIRLWRNHLEHKTSMPILAKKYGVTRQRIEQIIREAGL